MLASHIPRITFNASKLPFLPSLLQPLQTSLSLGVDKIELTSDSSDKILDATVDHPEPITYFIKVGYNPDESYDISPSRLTNYLTSDPLIQDALTRTDRSVKLLLHNPEQLTSTLSKDEGLKSLTASFDVLKEALQANTIAGTGVASNGLSLPVSHPLSLSLASLPLPPSSTVILPLNLLESSALPLPSTSHTVIASRPLTAYPDGGVGSGNPFKLVDYKIPTCPGGPATNLLPPNYTPPDYTATLKLALGHFDAEHLLPKVGDGSLTTAESETLEGARMLQGMLQHLDKELRTVRSFAKYEKVLREDVVPIISGNFEELDEETSEVLGMFFRRHGEAVRIATAQRTRRLVVGGGDDHKGEQHEIEREVMLQQYAGEWVLKQEGVGGVSLGMVREELVEQLLGKI